MPAQPTPQQLESKRRTPIRRFARGLLWGTLAVLVFHRPLIHLGAKWLAIRLARAEHMILTLRVAGNPWNTIELRDVSIRDDGSGSAPVERLKLDRLSVTCDVWKALRADWPRVLRRVDIGTLDGVIALQPPDPKKKVEPPTPIAIAFRELLSKPLFPVERLSIARVDLEVKQAAKIRGFHLEAGGKKRGVLSWEQLQVAGIPTLGPARADLAASDSLVEIVKLSALPEVTLNRLSLNRTTPTMPRGGLEVNADLGHGTLELRAEPSPSSGSMNVSLDMKAVAVAEVAAPLHIEMPAPMFVESFHSEFTGAPEDPATATAALRFSIRTDVRVPLPATTLRGDVKWERGILKISELAATTAGVEFRAKGEVTVPAKNFDPARLNGALAWTISGADLSLLEIAGASPLRGSLTCTGALHFAKGEARMVADAKASGLAHDTLQVANVQFHLDAQRSLNAVADAFDGLTARTSADLRGLTANGIAIDAVALKGSVTRHELRIEQLSATSGENRISGSAHAALKPGKVEVAGSPEFELRIAAPMLDQFGVLVNGAPLAGAIDGEARLLWDGKEFAGNVRARGTNLRLGKTPLGEFSAQVKLDNNAAVLEPLNIRLAGAGEITAKGRAALDGPMPYSGELSVNLKNLAKLEEVLAALGHTAKLGGALTVNWSAGGQIATGAHNGKLKVLGTGLRHDSLVLNEVRLGASYSPNQAKTDELLIVADKLRAGCQIVWKDGRLDASDLTASVAGRKIVEGHASIPLTPANPKGVLPFDEPVSAHLTGRNADIAQLASSLGIAAPVSGTASFDLAANGTLSKPDVKLTVEGRTLKTAKAPSLAPADFDAKLSLVNARLTLDAVAKQRDIQPFNVTASLPFDVEKLRAQPALVRDLPVQMSLKLPATPLAMIPRLAPAVRKLDGTVALNVQVAGTTGKPIVNGEILLAVKSLRMASESVPPVSNFSSKIVFHEDSAAFQNTRGEIGGGTFNLEGNVKLAQPNAPAFDLRFRSDKVLVLRDESITVRADADVTLKGPLNSASASGTVFVTQSRFLKDVDIVPLALPGKPKPQARTAAAPLHVSFPDPPLRDWKFDIAIKTRESDLFLIRGNLAKGAAALDLRLGGTGLNPFLTGHVQTESFSAVLPVSKLEVRRGTITFSEDDPFNPHLDIQAESQVGKNLVKVGISGTGNAPRMELESEPPLAQKDILSLLTTGTTTGEIGANASALATKAALLTVKRWYRKVFPGRGDDDDANGKGQGSLLDRFEVDVGNVDPKTGRPDVNASVRLTDRLYFLGDIDMQGQFIGKVKYLLRFR